MLVLYCKVIISLIFLPVNNFFHTKSIIKAQIIVHYVLNEESTSKIHKKITI